MINSNEDIVNTFFAGYRKHDMNAIKAVMDENVKWYFLGRHPLAGVKNGVEEVVAFFDTMGNIMSKSKPEINKLIIASNEKYFIECQHIQTHRDDGINISHYATVLWTIENGRITGGRHFFADPEAVNEYFTRVTQMDGVRSHQ